VSNLLVIWLYVEGTVNLNGGVAVFCFHGGMFNDVLLEVWEDVS